MRILYKAVLATACALFATVSIAADTAPADGVLTYKHQQTVADNSMDPSALTIGEFFHDYPRGAPMRTPMVPTKEVVTLRVHKSNGESVEIVQDLEDSKQLFVGDKVTIKQVDGKDTVVPAE